MLSTMAMATPTLMVMATPPTVATGTSARGALMPRLSLSMATTAVDMAATTAATATAVMAVATTTDKSISAILCNAPPQIFPFFLRVLDEIQFSNTMLCL